MAPALSVASKHIQCLYTTAPFLYVVNRNQSTGTSHRGPYYLSSRRFGNAQLSPDIYKDYYNILGVNHGASKQEIRGSYLQLAKKWHPDVHKTEAAKQSAETKFMFSRLVHAPLW